MTSNSKAYRQTQDLNSEFEPLNVITEIIFSYLKSNKESLVAGYSREKLYLYLVLRLFRYLPKYLEAPDLNELLNFVDQAQNLEKIERMKFVLDVLPILQPKLLLNLVEDLNLILSLKTYPKDLASELLNYIEPLENGMDFIVIPP